MVGQNSLKKKKKRCDRNMWNVCLSETETETSVIAIMLNFLKCSVIIIWLKMYSLVSVFYMNMLTGDKSCSASVLLMLTIGTVTVNV